MKELINLLKKVNSKKYSIISVQKKETKGATESFVEFHFYLKKNPINK